jgi:hypothetical protein
VPASATEEVGVVVPDDEIPLPAAAVPAVVALVVALGAFVSTPVPVVPVSAVPGKDEGVMLLVVEPVELVNAEVGGGDAVGVRSSEIPLLPSTDPVWMLDIGLHGVGVMLGGAGA